MTWMKVDDGLYDHPKMFDAPDCAVALWTRAGSWAARNLTDGFVPAGMARRLCDDPERAVKELVTRGLWEEVEGGGFQFHDWLDHNRSKADIEAERAYNARKAALYRDKEMLGAVRKRDGSRCRYCAVLVDWKDRRSSTGGTYDHVDPVGPNTLDNLVVACRGCNSRKAGRTPADAGMPLLQPKALTSTDHRTRTVLDTDQNGSGSDQVPDPTRPVPGSGTPPTSESPTPASGGRGAERPPARESAVHVPTSSPEVRAAALRSVKPPRKRSKQPGPGDRPLVASVPPSTPSAPLDPRAEQDRLAELDAVQAADPAPAERVPPSPDASGPPADLREQETA